MPAWLQDQMEIDYSVERWLWHACFVQPLTLLLLFKLTYYYYYLRRTPMLFIFFPIYLFLIIFLLLLISFLHLSVISFFFYNLVSLHCLFCLYFDDFAPPTMALPKQSHRLGKWHF